MKNILDIFEDTAERYGGKTALVCGESRYSYEALKLRARSLGSHLAEVTKAQRVPVLIYLPKSIESIVSLLATAYSGNFYVMLDIAMPPERAKLICENLNARAVITDTAHEAAFAAITQEIPVVDITEADEKVPDEEKLWSIRRNMTETDPLYVLYTSGSTGVPKGVVISHRNVIAYAGWVIKTFCINEQTVFGNQTPFYFSMSVTDIFATLFTGATLHILPKSLFSFPLRLMEYLKQEKVNTIYWVPSALCIVANTKTLDYIKLPDLKKVLFAGEVMPTKQLNMWISHMPDILYANLYGPTETTDICAYYVIDRKFAEDEALPIGYPCENCGLLILDENGKEAEKGQAGELCVRGPFVALGYYNNPEKTAQAFVKNPCNPYYPETVYRTGDLVREQENGALCYMGRRDFQIKHMGYRIELGEIETAAFSLEKMEYAVCIYDTAEDKIILVYQAKLKELSVMEQLSQKLPRYMQPAKCIRVKKMVMNANGKIDRAWLKKNYKTL